VSEPLDVVGRYPEVFSALPLRKYDGGQGWDIPCPCVTNHRRYDKRWSARVWEDGDRMRFWCGRGCRWPEAVAAMGVTKRAWFRRAPEEIPVEVQPKIVKRYRYEDAQGNLLFEVCRTEPKGFFQRRPGPDGKGWVYDLRQCHVRWEPNGGKWERVGKDAPGGVHMLETRRVPYRWQTIRKKPGHPVIVVEGEKAVEALEELGYVAICSPLGAGKWPLEFGGYLTDRDVAVFADNDEPGLEHAAAVAGSAQVMGAKSVRIIRSGTPSTYVLPDGGDVYDWLQSVGDPKAGELRLKKERYEAVKALVRGQRQFAWVEPPKELPRPSEVAYSGRKPAAKGRRQVSTNDRGMVDVVTAPTA
jgi:hypothetical protein